MSKVTGRFFGTPPTLTDGVQQDLRLNAAGALVVDGGAASSPASPQYVSSVNTQSGGAASRGFNNYTIFARDASSTPALIEGVSRIFNGTSFDLEGKPYVAARVTSSAAAGNPALAKAGSSDVRQWWGQNGAAITYLQIYNKATAPIIGTDTPIMTYPIPASAAFSQAIGGGFYCPLGVGFAFTTDAAGTAGAAAAAIVAFALLAS